MRARMKELRARDGLTQDDLARMVGASRETIPLIEKGDYNPSLNLAHAIAKALKATIAGLFMFDDLASTGAGMLWVLPSTCRASVCLGTDIHN